MILETKRLILRPWNEEDAQILYELAKDDRVGPNAGFPTHTNVENSRDIISSVLSVPNTFAVVLKEIDKVVGDISLKIGKESALGIKEDEAEFGFWLGVPYWGQGIIPEAVHELQRFGFQDLHLQTMWCAYYDGNKKSQRTQEKCGFVYHHTLKDVACPLLNEIRTNHINFLSKEHWLELI